MVIELINVGRRQVNKTVVVKNWNGVWRELGKHLMSKDVELVEQENEKDKYMVVCGARTAGEIKIIQHENTRG